MPLALAMLGVMWVWKGLWDLGQAVRRHIVQLKK
jgi:hypothetical protein